jgi:hypothetical protein
MDTPLSMNQPAGRTIRLRNDQVSRYDRAFGWVDVLPDFGGTEEWVSCGFSFAARPSSAGGIPGSADLIPVWPATGIGPLGLASAHRFPRQNNTFREQSQKFPVPREKPGILLSAESPPSSIS